jgi:hypothetical protein
MAMAEQHEVARVGVPAVPPGEDVMDGSAGVMAGPRPRSFLKLSGVARVFMGRVEDVVVSDIPVNEGTLEVDWTAIYAAQRDRLFGLALIIL